MLQGIFPPLATPFDAEGALDLRAFESNLAAYASHDLGGYLVLGSNGESPYLDDDERVKLVRAARKGAGRKSLLVGTGQESTRATIAFTRKAADLGADAALVLTPNYYKSQMTPEALRRHFEAVADASPIPLLVYSVPAFTGLTFQPGLAAALAGHPRIVGMKESSGDLSLLGRIIAAVPSHFEVACGSAPVLYPALCIGANAGIVAVSCCAPAVAVALYRAFTEGDHARARRLQDVVTPLGLAITVTYGVAGLKAAIDLAGLRGGHVRAPLLPLPEAARHEIQALLERAQQVAEASGGVRSATARA
ncbi:MAG TPA: dihydrodipicolinate synthase family protein [Vicinamibacteria bacterium]